MVSHGSGAVDKDGDMLMTAARAAAAQTAGPQEAGLSLSNIGRQTTVSNNKRRSSSEGARGSMESRFPSSLRGVLSNEEFDDTSVEIMRRTEEKNKVREEGEGRRFLKSRRSEI